jgi:hypothetical protein
MSARDRKAMNMVVKEATGFITYNASVATFSIDFGAKSLQNVFVVMRTFGFSFFHAIKSSVNKFCYYNMSTKYRERFLHMKHVKISFH